MVLRLDALARRISTGGALDDRRGAQAVAPEPVIQPAVLNFQQRQAQDGFTRAEDPGRALLGGLGIDAGLARTAPQLQLASASGTFPGLRGVDAASIRQAQVGDQARDLRGPSRQRRTRGARQAQRIRQARTKARRSRRTNRVRQTQGARPVDASHRQMLDFAKQRARALGLRITSERDGRHARGSYHYQGRAIDVAGSPAQMAQFYREMSQHRPTELFYDPIGGMKNGRNIGAIGGHSDHVHVAF